MPYRRRFRRYRRRGRRRYRKRRYRKKFRSSLWGKTKYNVHRYRRMGRTQELALSSNTSGQMATAFDFNMQDLVSNTELTSLYDQYRIDFVTVIINWSPKVVNQTAFNLGPNQMSFPNVYYSKDYDDNVTPTSLTAFKQRGNIRTFRLTPFKNYKIHVKPAVQNAVIRDATTTPPTLSTNPVWHKKLDCAAPDIHHFGLKMLIDYAPGQDLASVNIQKVYHVTMFATR